MALNLEKAVMKEAVSINQRVSKCTSLKYIHVKSSTQIFLVPAFALVVRPLFTVKGPNTSMPEHWKGGVFPSRWVRKSAMFCCIALALNFLHSMHLWMSLSILFYLLRAEIHLHVSWHWLLFYLDVWHYLHECNQSMHLHCCPLVSNIFYSCFVCVYAVFDVFL